MACVLEAASNNWCDQLAPTDKPTDITFPAIGSVSPGALRAAEVEALKRDLAKPKRMLTLSADFDEEEDGE